MTNNFDIITPAEALRLMANAEFRPMDQEEINMFSGVQTDNPMIAEYEEIIVVLDGNELQLIDADSGAWINFELTKTAEG